jgi:hypothetical protein
MILTELLARLRTHLDSRAEYAVVVGPRPRADEPQDDDSWHPVVTVYMGVEATECILRMSDVSLGEHPASDRMTRADLVECLQSHAEQYGTADVETSSSGPGDDFRVDFPIVGTGWGDESRVVALLW